MFARVWVGVALLVVLGLVIMGREVVDDMLDELLCVALPAVVILVILGEEVVARALTVAARATKPARAAASGLIFGLHDPRRTERR